MRFLKIYFIAFLILQSIIVKAQCNFSINITGADTSCGYYHPYGLVINGGTPPYHMDVYKNNSYIGSYLQSSYDYMSDGLFRFVLTDSMGCVASDSVNSVLVQVDKRFYSTYNQYNFYIDSVASYCGGGNISCSLINAQNCTYNWQYGNQSGSGSFYGQWISDTEKFYITVTNNLNPTCSYNDSIRFVEISQQLLNNAAMPSSGSLICLGDTLSIILNYTNVDAIEWFSGCGNGSVNFNYAICGSQPYSNTIPFPGNVLGNIYTANCSSNIFLTIQTTASGCSDTTSYLIQVIDDCVYPGDANYDLVANNLDLLNIGVAYGDSGNIRPNASTNWNSQACIDWTNNFSGNVNYKQADCNGDGVVSNADTLAIYLNYGQVHQKTSNVYTSDYKMQLTCDKLNYSLGDSINIEIELSKNGGPISDFYGSAFSIVYPEIIDEQNIQNIIESVWIGNSYLKIINVDTLNNIIDFGITLINHQNILGNGIVLKIKSKIKDQLTETHSPFYFYLVDGYYNDNIGITTNLESLNDSIYIINNFLNTAEIINQSHFAIEPNPSNGVFKVSNNQKENFNVSILDVCGREVMISKKSSNSVLQVDLSNYSKGIYSVVINSNNNFECKRIIIE